MIQVIATHPELVIMKDEHGKFLYTDNDEVINLPELPLVNTHFGVNGVSEMHRDVQAMLS